MNVCFITCLESYNLLKNSVSGGMQPPRKFFVWKKTTSIVWKKTQATHCLEGCVWNTMSGGKPFSGQMSGSMCLEVCPLPIKLDGLMMEKLAWEGYEIAGKDSFIEVTYFSGSDQKGRSLLIPCVICWYAPLFRDIIAFYHIHCELIDILSRFCNRFIKQQQFMFCCIAFKISFQRVDISLVLKLCHFCVEMST